MSPCIALSNLISTGSTETYEAVFGSNVLITVRYAQRLRFAFGIHSLTKRATL